MIRLDTVDSTNNYAMQRIEAGLAAHGEAVLATRQTSGKGQRGKSWQDAPGESLLMSIILMPGVDLGAQPLFLAAVAVAVAEVVQRQVPAQEVTIKWPNDILIADKKAAGILIENVVRGATWQWAVVGIGLNVGQANFSDELPHATSLRLTGGEAIDLERLAGELADAVTEAISQLPGVEATVLERYNEMLHRRGERRSFLIGTAGRQLKILGMNAAGMLLLEDASGRIEQYAHGSVEWIWG